MDLNYSKFKDLSLSSLIDKLLSLSGEELSILACILGFAITSNTTIEEQDSIGNFFELLGEFILTTSAQNYKLQSSKLPSSQELKSEIDNLYNIIFNIKRNQ